VGKPGRWAFLIGIVLAVLLGLMGNVENMLPLMVFVGIVLGILNLAEKDIEPFLVSGTILVIVSTLGAGVMNSIPQLANTLEALVAIFVSFTVVLTIKRVFELES
jgi:hypothetical protein